MQKLFKPDQNSSGEDNGQITIIGGSKLFHGAPILSLRAASKFVDMVFFASPEKSTGEVASKIKAQLSSFVWVPWEDVHEYVKKSDAVLIGPGLMRYGSEKNKTNAHNGDCDEDCQLTRGITRELLLNFKNKKWVIDAGSLQTMKADWIPNGSILTPNKKEYEILFKDKNPEEASFENNCTIVLKGPETMVYSPDKITAVKGGNPGLTKGGTGDCLAGLTAALYAKNNAHLAASAASFILKAAADRLYQKVGTAYNADDLASQIPLTYKELLG